MEDLLKIGKECSRTIKFEKMVKNMKKIEIKIFESQELCKRQFSLNLLSFGEIQISKVSSVEREKADFLRVDKSSY